MNKNNYRVYDKTGGGEDHDFFASCNEEAVKYGREWIEGGDWEPGPIAEPLNAEVCSLHPIGLDEQGGYAALDGTRYTPDADGVLLDADGSVLTDESGEYLHVGDAEEGERVDCSGVTPFVAAPDCEADEHDWQAPYEVLGGCKENPGEWSSDHGGLRFYRVCSHCGIYRIEDTGATNSCGERATSIRYQEADEESQNWVEERQL